MSWKYSSWPAYSPSLTVCPESMTHDAPGPIVHACQALGTRRG